MAHRHIARTTSFSISLRHSTIGRLRVAPTVISPRPKSPPVLNPLGLSARAPPFFSPIPSPSLSHRNMGSMAKPNLKGRLNGSNINPNVLAAKYAVRGELAVKAEEYRVRLENSATNQVAQDVLPFDKVIFANIGNPQQLDQKPITFFRQVLSILEYPALLDNEEALRTSFGYKQDVIDRAKKLLKAVQSVGAYSQSHGVPAVRESVARFIERRDGFPADPARIYLSAGASSGVNTLLHVLCAGPKTGVLVPIPQYPLYTATLSLLNAQCVPYYLDESDSWGTDVEGIRAALAKAREDGIEVRAIVVINPGNPTGASLSPDAIKSVIDVAVESNLVILADEVYQTNVFKGEFTSFKKRLRQLQQVAPVEYDHVELASLHSISQGIMLCAPVTGQCLLEMMVNPPVEGDPSYELYQKEYNTIRDGLFDRAQALYKAFQQMEGVECQEPGGAMYLFPTINLPPKAIEAAKAANREPDEFYALRLLDATGVCVVPGSGFGQKEGTLHFRTTFLAPGTAWADKIVKFHKEFMNKYS
ncbi:alanine transaminase [Histoplasma capsulatum H143]|uniref:Alanine aminotransferase 1 n=1 Tax=Ajellomyces capsulatus (strain H143) TaxID=544712 RepID=C6HCW6_AJECH|nr:alanine transaminase [Histoplasma capsulatum H143]